MIGTSYAYADDTQRTPTVALGQAEAGGAGTVLHLDGTGWRTLDARVSHKGGAHRLSAGVHGDRYRLNSRRYLTSDWLRGGKVEGAWLSGARWRTRCCSPPEP